MALTWATQLAAQTECYSYRKSVGNLHRDKVRMKWREVSGSFAMATRLAFHTYRQYGRNISTWKSELLKPPHFVL